jgi:hypothetical protein
MLFVYVDDIIVSFRSNADKGALVEILKEQFDLKQMGKPTRLLGIEIFYREGEILLSQGRYANELVESYLQSTRDIVRVPMQSRPSEDGAVLDSKMQKLYRRAVGMLIYLAVCTRPDLSYTVGFLAKKNGKATDEFMSALINVLKYVSGTLDVCLPLRRSSDDSEWKLTSFCDSNHASETDRVSRYGFIVLAGISPIIWTSRALKEVTLSSCESEFISGSNCGIETIHMGRLHFEIVRQKALTLEGAIYSPPKIYMDNLSEIFVILRKRDMAPCLKHVDIKHRWMVDAYARQQLDVGFVPGVTNVSDLLTKPLARLRLYQLMNLLGMIRVEDLELGGCATTEDAVVRALTLSIPNSAKKLHQ